MDRDFAGQRRPQLRVVMFCLAIFYDCCLGFGGTSPEMLDVAIGLNGVWKVGQVTSVKVTIPKSIASRAKSLSVLTFDGDGVAVNYERSIEIDDDTPLVAFWTTVTIGRSDQRLRVQVVDSLGAVLGERELSGSELGKALPPGQPWIVAIGNTLGVESASQENSVTGLPNFSTTLVSKAEQLPDNWRGFSGCDALIVACSNEPLIVDISGAQWQAISDWVSQGGSMVLSLGDYAVRMPADHPIHRLLPGTYVDRLPNISTSPLEASTATNVQLAPIVAVRLKDVRGKVELSMVDNSGKRFPWWVRHSNGKGVIHYFGSDLDDRVFREWKDRRVVWERVLANLWSLPNSDPTNAENNVSGASYLGYDDLIGQLRATLDYFPTARIFSFGEITLYLVLILIVIGPFDYWVSVHWLRRPQFSWYLAGTMVGLSSIALVWLEWVSTPKQLLLNSAQVVDFLPEQKRTMVSAWTHVYSSRARTFDVSLKPENASQESDDVRLDWQGLPGKGLGGMESNLLIEQGMPAYSIDVTSSVSPKATAKRNNRQTSIRGVGIPSSGTKCLFSTWSETLNPNGESRLRELEGIDQIEGQLVNPISQDILQPLLMYHNWVYQLPSRIRSGEEISITYEMLPKDLMRRLNRRRMINSNDVITRWNPDDRESIDRLLEIMMFYKASGGMDYSRLQHRFQPRIDISNLLSIDHAVLFGQLAKPLASVKIENVDASQVRQETNTTWCRVILPVRRDEE